MKLNKFLNKRVVAILLVIMMCLNITNLFTFAIEVKSQDIDTIQIIEDESTNEEKIQEETKEESEKDSQNDIQQEGEEGNINENEDNNTNDNTKNDIEDDEEKENNENIEESNEDTEGNEENKEEEKEEENQEEETKKEEEEENTLIIVSTAIELQEIINKVGTTPTTIYLRGNGTSTQKYIRPNQTIIIAKNQDITLKKDATFTYESNGEIKVYSSIYQRNGSLYGDDFLDTLFQVEGKLTLEDITIDGNIMMRNAISPLIVVNETGILKLKNDSILSNNRNSSYEIFGGGILNYGTVYMESGSAIRNNESNAYGGGVMNYGTFYMEGGKIISNTSGWYGGGVNNSPNGKFYMSDGAITNNEAPNYKGGGVDNCGIFTMTGGSITNNTTGSYGGGISNYDNGSFTMINGTIDNNTSTSYGAGIANYGSATISIVGGIIINNNSSSYGGAIYNSSNAIIKNSVISGNTGTYGGAIMNYGTMEIVNSEISNNSATYGGGGIYGNKGKLELITTVVKNNNSTKGSGGVHLGSNGNFIFTSGALYNNIGSPDSGTSTTIVDFIVSTDVPTYSLMAANKMVDSSDDAPTFEGTTNQHPYVWVDVTNNEIEYQNELISMTGKTKLRAQISNEEIDSAIRDLARVRNITQDIEYENFEKALNEINNGDVLEFISTSDDGHKIGIYPAIIDKEITIQIHTEQYLTYLGKDKTILTIVDGGNLTIENPEKDENKMAILGGKIIVESGATLTLNLNVVPYGDDTKNESFIIDVKENGNLILDGKMPWVSVWPGLPLEIILAQNTYITIGDDFDIHPYAKGIQFTLDKQICDAFREAEYEEKLDDIILIANCNNEDILNKITFSSPSPLENKLVTITNNNGNIVLHKIVISKDAVYINGVNGNDSNTGLSEKQAVKTFNKALEIAKENGLDIAYVVGEIRESGILNGELDDNTNLTLLRFPTYNGVIIRATSNLTLSNLTLDGGSKISTNSNNGPLIYITSCTVTLNENTILQNNNVSKNTTGPLYPSCGGGVNVLSGTLILNGNATIQNCVAEFGGAIAINTQNGYMLMNNGNILNNYATISGGGIATVSIVNTNIKTIEVIKILGGYIEHNIANTCGGGIFIQSTYAATIGNEEKSETNVYIRYNEAYGKIAIDSDGVAHQGNFSGGGIYVNGGKNEYPNGEVYLFNVLVTNNVASSGLGGGGIGACLTSNVKLYSNHGGAIIDNYYKDNEKSDIYYSTSFVPGSERTFDELFEISPIMLGNNPYNWKNVGNITITTLIDGEYIDISPSAGSVFYLEEMKDYKTIHIYSDHDEFAKQSAIEFANVFITDNIGDGHDGGGGIGTNGNVIIGTLPYDTSELTVTKKWVGDEDEIDIRPDYVEVEILRSSDNWETYEVYGIIRLDNSCDWTKTIIVPIEEKDGIKYDYTVKEINVDSAYDWTITENGTFIFTIINTLKEKSDLLIKKQIAGNWANMNDSFEFTIEIDTTNTNIPKYLNTTYIIEVINGIVEDETDIQIGDKTTIPIVDGLGIIVVKLGHNDSIAIKDLPSGVKVTITEKNKLYYATYVVDEGDVEKGNNITLDMIDGNTSVIFTNTLAGSVPTGILLTITPIIYMTIIGVIGMIYTKNIVKKKINKNKDEDIK